MRYRELVRPLEHYQQLIARVWRQGQKAGTVVVHHIITRGTKDEDLMACLARKERTQDAFTAAIPTRRVSPVLTS